MERQHMTGDSSLLKSINQTTLLAIIRHHAPISRAELAKRTKLTRATVSALVEPLIARHLVAETGIGPSSGGRKPLLLEVNRSGGYVIGVDLQATSLLLLVADLAGGKVERICAEYERPDDPEATRDQLLSLIEQARGRLPASPLGLCAVGIGVHGFVRHPGETIRFVPHFGWKRVDWKAEMEARLGVPVWIDNEANLAALGELETDETAALTDMLYVSVGAGIGAGLILAGEVFRGRRGYAGEVGHTTIVQGGLACTCGNKGCLEMYASEKAFAAMLDLPYRPGFTERALKLLEAGDMRAHAALADIGASLGSGIVNMMHTFDPQAVVVGNAIARYKRWLAPAIEQALGNRLPFVDYGSVAIRFSVLGDEACATGAVFLGIRRLFELQDRQPA
ncbi:ROK family transcriptional regulator [Paenibacillus cymbidii]|uniref:ROK family transcriptional regulator n=1 Tax=Paenibacillus cymbidii TaxID=1639034 RepID=UPI00108162F6|nr:ROK family transcriptional regulator [Paenibacillus cymbidii]